MEAPGSPSPYRSLKQFLDWVDDQENWQQQLPLLLPYMPTIDDILLEMAWMSENERPKIRVRLEHFRTAIGEYLTVSRRNLQLQREEVVRAQQQRTGQHAYARLAAAVHARQEQYHD